MHATRLHQGESIGKAPGFGLAALLQLWILAPGAWAFDGSATELMLAQANAPAVSQRSAVQLEVSNSTIPRLDSGDSATRSARIDMSLFAPEKTSLGLLVGLTSSDRRQAFGIPGFAATSGGVDVGLRWRHRFDANHQIDIAAWRRLAPSDAGSLPADREPSYGARVEMNMSPQRKSGFVADRGFLGFQLESGARITVRKGGGGQPMVYYRTKF
jgi:hypothetical protein